jgi:hypothetical protein
MSQCLNTNACLAYHPSLQIAALELALRLYDSPDGFFEHLRVYATPIFPLVGLID